MLGEWTAFGSFWNMSFLLHKTPPWTNHFRWGDCVVLLALILGEAQAGPRWSKDARDGPANFRNGFAGNARALSSVSSVSFYVSEGSTTALCELAFSTDLDTVSGASVSWTLISVGYCTFTGLLHTPLWITNNDSNFNFRNDRGDALEHCPLLVFLCHRWRDSLLLWRHPNIQPVF